jgi:phosphatidylethanolamine/phosphatidyl-N-methylethanolamine N-methyltransferase
MNLQLLNAESWARHFRFFRLWLQRPSQIGGIVPSSPALARAMAQRIDAATPGVVVEFGGGTGSITRAILRAGVSPQDLFVFEREPALCAVLASRWPNVKIFAADVREVGMLLREASQAPVKTVISGLPLLSMSLKIRREIIKAAFEVLAPGGAFVQFTYGPKSPVPLPLCRRLRLTAERVTWIVSNVPPAAVWEYRRTGEARR